MGMLIWTLATLAGLPIVIAQGAAECLAAIFRTILLPVAGVVTVIALVRVPDSNVAHDAVCNFVTVAAAWIAAEGALLGSAVALRWLDARRNAI